VDARTDPAFYLIARTDAIAVEGLDAAIARARACAEAGPTPSSPKPPRSRHLPQVRRRRRRALLANITEFGATPLFTVEELRSAGVAMALYPLSAFRAMNKAAQTVYETLRREGTQKAVVPLMQTRAELYESIGYHAYEQRLDAIFSGKPQS
jgi:methylisocitrate lyase (EC 4.1.3.30)